MEPPLEIEAKFAVPDLDRLRARLRERKAQVISPPHLEINLRFDFPDGRLRSRGHVLRLRRDRESRLTLKTPGPDPEHRREIEVTVGDPAGAQALLTGLGLEVVFVYEKTREVFALEGARVMLDRLPFGSFAEIEAGDLEGVRQAAEQLGLAWDRRLPLPYSTLFEHLRQREGWTFRDATFANFVGLPPAPIEDLQAAGAAP
ncbi:MAG TPA: class IV adenylate cyclase [Anaerolineales bacterium]|nr:class IV adenylate cyclase [Anaerolineales bacterium]